MHSTNRPQDNKLFEDFLTKLKGYNQEFKDWVKIQLNGEGHLRHENESDMQESQTEQPANEERNRDKGSLEEDDKNKQEEAVIASVIDSMEDNEVDYLQHPLKIKTGEFIETGKYKAVLQVQDQDIDNFYQNLSSQYTTGKYNYDQMIALYNKIYIQDSKLDGKPITLSEAYVTNNHLFIKDQDFGTISDFNEMFYKSDELM